MCFFVHHHEISMITNLACIKIQIISEISLFFSEKSSTLPFENRKNISRLALSPNGLLLLSIDEGFCPLFIVHVYSDLSSQRGRLFWPICRGASCCIISISRAPWLPCLFHPMGGELFKNKT